MLEATEAQVRGFRLARQHLLAPPAADALVDVAADLGGVHAQVMSSAELILWARTRGLTPGHVREALWTRRELVKAWTLRGTLHLHPAREFPLWAAAMSLKRPWEKEAWLRGHGLSTGDVERVVEAVAGVLGDEPMTREELADAVGSPRLRSLLLSGWGVLLKPCSYAGILCFGPNRGRNVTFVRPDRWLREWRRHDPEEALAEIVRRFLRAYGPATHEDFARWWGVVPAEGRRALRLVEDELEEVAAAGRRTRLLRGDVDALAHAPPPKSVLLLPGFDPYVLHYRPREALVAAEHVDRVFRVAGWVSATAVTDGRTVGVWELKRRSRRRELLLEPFGRLPRRALEKEAGRLGEFLGAPVELAY